jgi:hypothetical protein
MGFLDHSTNNIIIDAVLTNLGREFLARNDGSFSITKFALGDDEIDYTVIEKFGRTVGREKVEKNTPIFESLTSGNLAIKNKLISASTPTLTKLPGFSLTGPDSNNTVALTRTTTASTTTNESTIIVEQSQAGGGTVPTDLQDAAIVLECNNLFVSVKGAVPETINSDNIATYVIIKNPTTLSGNRSQFTFTLQAKNVSTALFNSYGDNSTVDIPVTASGISSGASSTFTVQIS